MNIGDIVLINIDGEILRGTIVNIYAVPKDWDLIDVNVGGVIYYGIKTEDVHVGV